MSRTPQLALQLSVADSVRLHTACDHLKCTIEDLAHENQSLRDALETAKAQALELERQLIFAQTLVKTRERQLAMLRRLEISTHETGLTKAQLTGLLALAHPDRWSQQQPASELAHELAVAINKLRADGRL
jgi:hypothetical protein